jgi:hypothetical protein
MVETFFSPGSRVLLANPVHSCIFELASQGSHASQMCSVHPGELLHRGYVAEGPSTLDGERRQQTDSDEC